ncbi:DNA-processing protein DprA [Cellulomonas fengjieae]|uniref:DNA-protecting protein DprA n=1 Tax=Cellulomonas fengjieae TaxID=2819978 RepID=A0ABS3SEC3_9CELL|nr:DNA-processing protein DprA [Cellulomonas fengjieae]MBO3084103.1 DNA-protecting protein DprA [Cellulomonas fengjieae]QVI64642.1 DNA-protecting protein DprA [Cellulomonas fengjieae]
MLSTAREEHAALVALLNERPNGARWPAITADVLEAGSALAVWHSSTQATLIEEPGVEDPLAVARRELERWSAEGHRIVTVLDDEYPERLRGIHQAPPVLFARGELRRDERAVSVVGSRAASERGIAIATAVARSLVSLDISVVAGLALGIDTAAHRAALESHGRTVAVIGTGINKVYPAANRDLHEEISRRGLLLSQFWPDAPPQKHTFLMRNATMSGFGLATVVVEAGEQSGARAQARMAVEHGRPVILTDLVVERNEWARALRGRPGVTVAAGIADVVNAVERIVDDRDAVSGALRWLTPA